MSTLRADRIVAFATPFELRMFNFHQGRFMNVRSTNGPRPRVIYVNNLNIDAIQRPTGYTPREQTRERFVGSLLSANKASGPFRAKNRLASFLKHSVRGRGIVPRIATESKRAPRRLHRRIPIDSYVNGGEIQITGI